MTKTMQKMPKRQIALIDYPGAQQSALLGLADLFRQIPRLEGMNDINIQTPVLSQSDLPSDIQFDAFVFPPSLDQGFPGPHDPRLNWARNQHAGGALACSVCVGAFWLAEAGLLNGRPATTHWALQNAFRTAYPTVDLRPDHILIDDLDVVTAGGLMAWLDLGLYLTGALFGPEAVSALSRQLLVDPAGREQRHYSSFRPNRHHGDAAILRGQRLMEQSFASPLPLSSLAAHAGLSLRSFQRRFQTATGLPPTSYLQALRVEKARGFLERSSDSIAQISWAVGYRDSAAFTRVFNAITGLTPGAYRNRFRAYATAPLSERVRVRI